jgi:hypothetical protein
MNIIVDIPALNRLCDIFEASGLSLPSSAATTSAAKAEPAAKATGKVEPAAKAAKTPAAPKVTIEELTGLANAVVEKHDAKVLRAVLDDAGIKGKKISNCEEKFYPAIKEKLEAKIAEGGDDEDCI